MGLRRQMLTSDSCGKMENVAVRRYLCACSLEKQSLSNGRHQKSAASSVDQISANTFTAGRCKNIHGYNDVYYREKKYGDLCLKFIKYSYRLKFNIFSQKSFSGPRSVIETGRFLPAGLILWAVKKKQPSLYSLHTQMR